MITSIYSPLFAEPVNNNLNFKVVPLGNIHHLCIHLEERKIIFFIIIIIIIARACGFKESPGRVKSLSTSYARANTIVFTMNSDSKEVHFTITQVDLKEVVELLFS